MVRVISFRLHRYTHISTATRIRRCSHCAQDTLMDSLLWSRDHGRWDTRIQVTRYNACSWIMNICTHLVAIKMSPDNRSMIKLAGRVTHPSLTPSIQTGFGITRALESIFSCLCSQSSMRRSRLRHSMSNAIRAEMTTRFG